MPLTQSRFHHYRALIAIAYADGYLHPDERSFINDLIDAETLLSPDQRAVLYQDFSDPPQLDDMLPHVTGPRDCQDLYQRA